MRQKKALLEILRRLIQNWAAPIGCGLLLLFLLKAIFFIGYVPSASMEPEITEGSCIIGIRLYGELRRGDVAVFRRDGLLLVKRVAGVPGDTVLRIDGVSLIVPESSYYMTGDNADDSIDSRYWEDPFVSFSDVEARVL